MILIVYSWVPYKNRLKLPAFHQEFLLGYSFFDAFAALPEL